MAKLTLQDITAGYGSAARANANNTLIEAAVENTLSRDGTGPNQMAADIDMNSNRVKNLAEPVSGADAVRLADLQAATVNTPLPDTTGHEGEFLQVAGGAAVWDTFTASDIPFTPSGTIAANTLQGAVEELDTETQASLALKLAIASNLSDVANKQTAIDNLTAVLAEETSPDKTAEYLVSYNGSATEKVKMETIVRYEERRQTVLTGSTDSSGKASYLSAGTGLAVNLAATTTPVRMTFAAGEDNIGPVNFRKSISADATGYWSSLAASTVSYLLFDRDTSTGALSAVSTIIRPQYGAVFDTTEQAILNFDGADASTTIPEEYGNTFSCVGNAQLDTAQFKFGTASLLLDGTGDYIQCTGITSMKGDGWFIAGWVRFNALPTAATVMNLVSCENADPKGIRFGIINDTGTYKSQVYLSSNGTGWDIASDDRVTPLSAPVVNTWYHWAIVYDPTAGRYYTYWNGAKLNDIISSSKVCAFTQMRFGANGAAGDNLNGWLDAIDYGQNALYPAGTTFTPPASAPVARAQWFDRITMLWKTGGPTTGWTTKQRVAAGQATTGASSVSSVTTYALRGSYISALTAVPAAGTKTSFAHNLGVIPLREPVCYAVNVTTDNSYTPGMSVRASFGGNAGYYMTGLFANESRNSASFTTGSNAAITGQNISTGASNAFTAASWKLQMVVDRGW